MSLLNKIILQYGKRILQDLDMERKNPAPFQEKILSDFLKLGSTTDFGKEHGFKDIRDLEGFRNSVPVSEYDDLEKYINRILSGEDDILWPGKIRWMAQSSGTSSTKSKYIPISHTNLKNCHYSGMTRMLINYLSLYPESKVFSGKALTLGGSVTPRSVGAGKGNIKVGDLSAIMLSNSPAIAEFARQPRKSTAILHDFNTKVERICKECSNKNITSISGVPSWNLVMLKRILEYNKASDIFEVWPEMELFMHGGISMEPYRKEYEEIFPGDRMHFLENYNASEGYFAFQDDPSDRSMLLCCNNSVFYEFIPLQDLDKALSDRYAHTETVETVKTGVPYAMVITTNSGLWRYLIGDTVIFTSLYPHKIKIVGRTKLFINAFGEELMISNAEKAIEQACRKHDVCVREYTIAPVYMGEGHRGCHQWLIEFSKAPEDMDAFTSVLDSEVCNVNSDYEAKRKSGVMDRLSIVTLEDGTFMKWMESRGKVGGQNKVPRLSNDRKIADSILNMLKTE